jgi:hypothetical protein
VLVPPPRSAAPPAFADETQVASPPPVVAQTQELPAALRVPPTHPITEEVSLPDEVSPTSPEAASRQRASVRVDARTARTLTKGEVKTAINPGRTVTRPDEPAAPRVRVPSRTELKPPVVPDEEHEDVPTAIIRPRSPQESVPESGESPVSAPPPYAPEVPTTIIRPRQALPGLDASLEPHHSEIPTALNVSVKTLSEEFSEEVTNVRTWEGAAPAFSQLDEEAEDRTRPIRTVASPQRVSPAPSDFSPEPVSESAPLPAPASAEAFSTEPLMPEPGDSTLPGVAPIGALEDAHGSRRSWVMVGIFLSVLTVCAIALVMFLEGRRTTPPALPRPPVQDTVPPREGPPGAGASEAPPTQVTAPATATAEPPPEEPGAPRLQPTDLVPLQASASSAQAQAPGTLTLVTRPYAKVFLESRTMGDTPLFKVSLPAGRHNLHLIGPDKTPRVLPVVIEPGKDTRLQLSLSELPGK